MLLSKNSECTMKEFGTKSLYYRIDFWRGENDDSDFDKNMDFFYSSICVLISFLSNLQTKIDWPNSLHCVSIRLPNYARLQGIFSSVNNEQGFSTFFYITQLFSCFVGTQYAYLQHTNKSLQSQFSHNTDCTRSTG